METIWSFLLLFAVVGVVMLVVVHSRRFKIEPRCPYCNSKDVVETNRETLATRTIETMGGGTFAGAIHRVQFDLKLTCRCHNCGQRFERQIRETY